MIIERQNILTGKFNTMDLPITFAQINEWMNGKKIQDCMSNLNSTQREFMISGMSEEEQKEFFNEKD